MGTFPTYDEGRNVMEIGGKRTTFTDFNDIGLGLLRDLSKVMSPLALADFEQARLRLDRMAKRVPLEAPWEAPRARLWEEWTRGCYGCLMTTGGWTEYGRALREPVNRLHWAGAETATVWSGYMDGAVSSGERAAAEVLAQIR